MGTLRKAYNSTVGRKLIMGLSGLGLVLFVTFHLVENLQLYVGSERFNGYVAWLHSFGPALNVAEVLLALLIIVHAVFALWITKTNREARGPVRYSIWRSKGDPSHANLASRNMIITGFVLLGFLGLHIWQFRFGPGINDGYATQVNGKQVLDLYRLVSETFHNPVYVGLYVAVMLFLGFHLRHGFWSAFQSLGSMNPRVTRQIYALGLILGIVLAAGFLMIPLWFYFGGGR